MENLFDQTLATFAIRIDPGGGIVKQVFWFMVIGSINLAVRAFGIGVFVAAIAGGIKFGWGMF